VVFWHHVRHCFDAFVMRMLSIRSTWVVHSVYRGFSTFGHLPL